MGNNDYFNYEDPFAGLASNSGDISALSMNFDDARFGTMAAGSTDQKDTSFWSYMHSMWNHYQDSRRHWKEAANRARNFQYQGPHFVSSNHRTGKLLAGRFDNEATAYAQEAKAGKDLYEIDATIIAGLKPWELTNSEITTAGARDLTHRGSWVHQLSINAGSMVNNRLRRLERARLLTSHTCRATNARSST